MIDLSPTAGRMLDSLPDYYWGNDVVERILQAWADAIDRLDAMLDTLKEGLVPTTATDDLKLLSIWEQILRLPVRPSASVRQRQMAVKAALGRLNATTAADVNLMLTLQAGGGFSIARDDPGLLQDTITIHYSETSFAGAMIKRLAQDAWPAHRELLYTFDSGFILDVSTLDTDAL